MKLQKAIALLKKFSDEDGSWYWTRPVTWRGTGAAITLDAHGRMVVMGLEDEQFFTPYDYELVDEWEVLASNVVLGELFNARSTSKP